MSLSPGPTLTQTDILSLPRPSAPIPSPSSTLAIWPTSTYSFDQQRTNRQFHLVSLTTATSNNGWEGVKDPQVIKEGLDSLEVQWLDDQTIVYLAPAKGGGEDSSDLLQPASQGEEVSDEEWKRVKEGWVKQNQGIKETVVWAIDVETKEEYKLGQFPVPISNLKTLVVPSTSSSASSPQALLAFSALVFPDGSLYTYNEQRQQHEQELKGSDIKVYDSTFVRHWDEWSPQHGEKNQVFVVRMSRNPKDFGSEEEEEDESEEEFEVVDEREGRWSFESQRVVVENVKRHQPKVISPMAGTKLECPVGPFGSSTDFSLSPSSLLIHSKDPHVSPSTHTRTNVYLFPLSPKSDSDASPKLLSLGTQGASSNPRFSPDGKFASWLEMREDGYEADRNRIMLYSLLEDGKRVGLTEEWDSSPGGFEWSRDGKWLSAITEERGHVVLYEIDAEGKREPKKLTKKHSVTSVSPLEDGRSLVGMNSFTTPNELYLFEKGDDDEKDQVTPLATVSRSLLADKKLHEGEEFTFAGSEGKEVHGWILFPPSHSNSKDSKRKYPMAFACHGGPQSAWNDGWSTRWNLQSYASKGYIVVAINRTGSTGFGQEFCDAIQNEWGGKPFRDLVAGVQYVKKAYPEIDGERMASLGASYGGFMQNWIQGHNDAFGFKALVCHDGVFSLENTYYATEELYFPTREFGGAPWEVPENYAKWNPQNHIKNWRTPELVIHGSRDYRLVESEGLGVFNTLQRLGIPSRLLIFPSENHWVLSPANSVQWHKEVFKWIGEWTNTKDECE